MKNYIKLQMPSIGINEKLARTVISALILPLSPTLEELNDVKTAISEAVTNIVVHAYNGVGVVDILAQIDDEENSLTVSIGDVGCGIADVKQAVEPLYTTKPDDERSGMGFTIMQTFMDDMRVESQVGKGTSVTMKKVFKRC